MNSKQIFDSVLKNGGITLDRDLLAYSGSGYAVAVGKKFERVKDLGISFESFDMMLGYYLHLVPNTRYIGIWINMNRMIFDLIEIVADRDQAIALGKQRKQIAIFDFERNVTVSLT